MQNRILVHESNCCSLDFNIAYNTLEIPNICFSNFFVLTKHGDNYST